MTIVTRFAPSPNGPLHLGHAYSAVIAAHHARSRGGEFLLRIEDIDGPRSRPEFVDAFRRDLEWLGLEWREVPPQSARLDTYEAAADTLEGRGLLYPSSANRRDIQALPARRSGDGNTYPGSARALSVQHSGSEPAALRLDIDAAMAEASECIWVDDRAGSVIADPRDFGDVILVRKELPASYHLAATLDDAADGVTFVTRGEDLFASTHVHRVLQELLGLPVPRYLHHDLIMGEDGTKLSKSRGSPALFHRRDGGEDGGRLHDELLARYLERQNNIGT